MANVINFYDAMPNKYKSKQSTYPNYDKIRIKIPNRMAILGSSGSGKSNVLLNLIVGMNCFTKIYFFVKCPDETLYKYFIEEIRAVEKKLKVEILTVSTSLDDLSPVDEFDKEENNLVVFDDIITDGSLKLRHVADLWVRGRKSNITTIFLSQSVRKNTDILIFKKIGTKRDLTMILSEYSLDKSVDELKSMYNSCNTSDITNFFIVWPIMETRFTFKMHL
jgi:hypothetical protein